MPIPTLSRSIPVLLLFLLFNPMALKAQLFGISDNDPRWGDWRSAPNFPGIEIRVACGTYVPSTGDAQWSFQFKNTYPKKVYLVYQEEAAESTGHPPTFSSPGGRNLDPGEKSDMYTDYLQGTCAARKQIFIKVNSISDDEGNQTEAKPGASQTSALAAASPDEPKPGNNASGGAASAKNGSSSASRPIIVVDQNSNSAGGNNSIVGTWTCSFLSIAPPPNPPGYSGDRFTVRITILDGGYSRDSEGGIFNEGTRWQQDGSRITVTTTDPGRREFEGVLSSSNSLTLQMVRSYYTGSLTCTR